MKMKHLALVAMVQVLTSAAAHAAPAVIAPDAVNRLFSNQQPSSGIDWNTNEKNQSFSTFQWQYAQSTLLYTSGTTLSNAFLAAFGPGYTIGSVKLVVGSVASPYTTDGTAGAYQVLTAYDPDTVSWFSFNQGGVAGTDYAFPPLATGVVGAYQTIWTFDPSLITGWINNPSSNLGLYFPDIGSAYHYTDATDYASVSWVIDVAASGVPEPGSFALISLGLAAAGFLQRRRHGCPT